MLSSTTRPDLRPASDIVERIERGLVVLGPKHGNPHRRVLFVNSYGGADVWQKIKSGLMPPHHLWGCLELARLGYEVALAEPIRHFEFRRPVPHDLGLLRWARAWLRPDDIIYCGHTLLYWVPLFKLARAIKCRLVSLTYAREELDFARAHDGIIALTPAAADEAKKKAPGAKIAHLAWGCDLTFFPRLEFNPQWFLSCGITHRDFNTLSAAATRSAQPIRLICPGLPAGINWSPNVTVIDGGQGWNYQKTAVSYHDLFHVHYAGAFASLIILKNDPSEYTAVGFTNLLEAMALACPVIVTRTGAIPGEIDVEDVGCGLHVPAGDPAALAEAIRNIAANPRAARAMGEKGRKLAEEHYNIERYAGELHKFFERL